MTTPDPIELILHRSQQAEPVAESNATLLARAVEDLAAHADELATNELLDHGIGLISTHANAHGAVLYRYERDHVRVVRRLRSGWSPRPEELPSNWFPWSLGQISPTRFLFVADSRNLPIGPGTSPVLGDIGVHSCVHLPVLDRNHPAGALQLFWAEPVTAWDDELGPTLRNLGRFMIARATNTHVELTLT